MSRWRAAATIGAFALASLCASPARADDPAPLPPPPAAAHVDPPQLTVEGKPEYPEGATEAASVLLEIVVDTNGAVSDVRVVEGAEPFASAAVDAARRSQFEPARRAGQPVRARIRMAMSFTPPPPPPAEPAPGAPEQPARPAKQEPVVEDVQEVRVVGQRDDPKTPTEHRMGRAEMRVIPGAFGDPFRAIDILPGVVPIVSGLPFFYLRGAPPSAVGYYVDEVRVPYLFHFALGPGVIQPALIDEVAVHPAAFPGRFGRYAGGIVSGTTRDPASELYGEAQIRIFDAGAYVEAPFANGRATAGVGGRYSYTAGVISLFAPDLTVDYRDYNARVSYDLGNRWHITAFTFGAFDYVSNMKNGRERVLFASEFHRLDTHVDRRGADGSVTRIGATVGIDRTRLEGARFAQDVVMGLRGRHRMPVSKEVDVEVGADLTMDHYSGGLPNPYSVSFSQYEEAEALFGPRTDTATGLWASSTWRPASGWDLTATMRADLYTSYGKIAVGPSPRVSMKVPLTKRIAFLGALGVSEQPPAFTIPIPAVGYRGLPGGLAFAYQKSAGFEFGLPLKFTLKTVGFHHSYFNMRDFAQERGDIDIERPQELTGSPSQAFGLEVFLMRKLSERYSAFSSLTLNRAQLGSRLGTSGRVSPFDRTYVFQLGGVADLGSGWRASTRFLTYRGWPTDPPGAQTTTSDHLPPFYRLDLRVEKRWTFKEHRWIAFVMEGLNVTGSKEILSRTCSSSTDCENNEIGPVVVPSLGVEGAL